LCAIEVIEALGDVRAAPSVRLWDHATRTERTRIVGSASIITVEMVIGRTRHPPTLTSPNAREGAAQP
jgi:hypothetical protein